MSSQELISMGCIRRIGNKVDIRIWNMPWLNNELNLCIKTFMQNGLEEVTVDALTKPGLLEWDNNLIRDLFDERDSDEILSIQLPRSPSVNSWYWIWDPKGQYIVKIGYRVLSMKNQPVLAPIVIDWNFIWSLKVPPKMCNFTWRALAGFFPTRVAIAS